jgi:6-phosphofructo-2-kinase/fructose-2,6-biphosphatase 2
MLHWFEDRTNAVAILDTTNSTKSRRKWIYERLKVVSIERALQAIYRVRGFNTDLVSLLIALFVESNYEDAAVNMDNVTEVKTTSLDYLG